MPESRASQIVAEALQEGPGAAQSSQLVAEILYEPINPAHAESSQITAEVLAEFPGNALVSQEVAEVLGERLGNVLSSQLVVEILIGHNELSQNLQWYDPMSNYIFPMPVGLTWPLIKRPRFSTGKSPHVSGREVRVQNYQYPIWEWDIPLEFLRADTVHAEYQSMIGFYLMHGGSFDTFLFKDPTEDNTVTLGTVGVGDGVTTKWTFMKTLAGFAEPVGYVVPASLLVYINGIAAVTGWTLVAPNQIVFSGAIPTGDVITASYTWYYRVKFSEDSQDYENFMYLLWTEKKVKLESIK